MDKPLVGYTVRYHHFSFTTPDGAMLFSGRPEYYGETREGVLCGIEILDAEGKQLIAVGGLEATINIPDFGVMFLLGARDETVEHGFGKEEEIRQIFAEAINAYQYDDMVKKAQQAEETTPPN